MNKTYILLLLLVALIGTSCNKKNALIKENEIKEEQTQSEIFTIKGIDYVVIPGQGIDSYVGRILTPSNKFTFDYGWYSNEGPQSLMDNFKNTFNAYHYQAFFTAVGMDPKTFGIFKEEAEIIQIFEMSAFDKELMYDCDNCNVVAEIQFKDKMWYFPYQENQELVNTSIKYDFTYLQDKDWNYKIFRSLKDASQCGLFAYPKDKEESNRLSVTCQKIGDQSEAERILYLLRMVSKDSIK